MLPEQQTMATAEKPPSINVDPKLQAAVDRVLKGVRDAEAMRQAAERMDRMREEMRQRVGNVNLAVPLIRETRDEE
jgi:Tfp pilus assembly ATPase PilU